VGDVGEIVVERRTSFTSGFAACTIASTVSGASARGRKVVHYKSALIQVLFLRTYVVVSY
jgi:hypothetical protein